MHLHNNVIGILGIHIGNHKLRCLAEQCSDTNTDQNTDNAAD